MKIVTKFGHGLMAFVLGLGAGAWQSEALAAELALAEVPLFIKDGVDPNIIVSLDDSGSMAWAYVPDGISGTSSNRRFKSPYFNALYYNPDIVYLAPKDVNGNPFSTSFTAAYEHGFVTSKGTRNLSTSYRPTRQFAPTNSAPTLANHATGRSYSAFTETLYDSACQVTGTRAYPAFSEPGSTTSNTAAYYYIHQAELQGGSACTLQTVNGQQVPVITKITFAGCNGTSTDEDCYRLVRVGTFPGVADLDNDGDVDTDDDRQNFANWYSFYRTRYLSMISAASLGFQAVDEDVRVAYQNLWKCQLFTSVTDSSTVCRDYRNSSSYQYDNRLRPFSGSHRSGFYEWLRYAPASGGTPLRSMAKRAGFLIERTDKEGAYAKDPGTQKDPQYACRPSFHIAFTDGIWNSDNITDVGNADSTSATTPGGCSDTQTGGTCEGYTTKYGPQTYTPGRPFSDGNANSVADIVFQQWITDAQPNIPNQVPTYMPVTSGTVSEQYWNPRNDPAEWQHLTTFMVGLGLSTSLVGDSTRPRYYGSTFASDAAGTDGYAGIESGTKSWPGVGTDDSDNPYDLWHAAINGRGDFFSAESPTQLVDAFTSIIAGISDRTASAASVALDSAVINGLNFAYHASFNSQDWTGDVRAFALDPQTFEPAATFTWSAGELLKTKAWNSRNVQMANASGDLVNFNWSNLSAAQQASLNLSVNNTVDALGQSRVKYLKGDASLESDTGFRIRNGEKLGDIIHSSPTYVGVPARNRYDDLEGLSPTAANSYTSFKSTWANRAPMVYVGSNSGMLHGFDALTGEEKFAFVPTAVIPELRHLTYPGYTHRYYVDGSSETADVFDGTSWRTILVGTLRGGGKSVFALDVTDPDNIDLLWEFTDTDLGLVHGKPVITRLHNGKWGVMFGNGYNSTNHRAVLFVVDATSGALIKKLGTGIGSLADTNGLATASPVDINGDLITDYVYAGDLHGNVWRFDLIDTSISDPIVGNAVAPAKSNANQSKWKIAYGGKPLFAAKDGEATPNRQPITANVVVAPHETGTGVIVMFGTGKYLESSDAQADTSRTQTYYGIWDRFTAGQVTTASTLATIDRDDLQEQTLSVSDEETFEDEQSDGSKIETKNVVRIVSDNDVEWYSYSGTTPSLNKQGWYVDFMENGTMKGEMLVTDSLVLGKAVIFATTTPNEDPCKAGVDRWLWGLNVQSGGVTAQSVFDFNNDGVIDDEDRGQGDKIYNSVKTAGIGAPAAVGEKLFLNLDQSIDKTQSYSGYNQRRSWRMVR